jgi:hypothetical protein
VGSTVVAVYTLDGCEPKADDDADDDDEDEDEEDEDGGGMYEGMT